VFRHIVLATDFTEASESAREAAASLASAFETRLTVVHVCEPPAFAAAGSSLAGADLVGRPCSEGAEVELGRLVWRLRARDVKVDSVLRHGVAWELIVRVAKEVGADLVVAGTHGRHGLAHAYYGSVAEKLVQESPVPVLVVPRRSELGARKAGER
jgi:nucleotide-binding universal stress UspA family protein